MAKPLVYIAAPYTHPDPVENTNNAIKVGTLLREGGHVTPIIPHLTMFWHLLEPRPYQVWIDYDLELIEHCDAVLRLSGASSGADGEVARAKELGIRVFHEDEGGFRKLALWATAVWMPE